MLGSRRQKVVRSKEPRYYTVEESAKILRVSVTTVYRWLKAGRLKGAFQPGGKKWLVPASALWKALGPIPNDVVRD